MSCLTVQKFISAYLDRNLAEGEMDGVAQHLSRCRECAARSEEYQRLRSALLSFPPVRPPAQLASRLQVLASHERARRLAQKDLPSTVRHWSGWFSLRFDNLMRPLAIPFAGGLVSALCLFSMLMPTLLFRFNFHNDVPTAFYTRPSLEETMPMGVIDDELVIELEVDERGRALDYSIQHGIQSSDREAINNLVLFSSFQPATLFGRPTAGKVRVTVRRGSRIVVRG